MEAERADQLGADPERRGGDGPVRRGVARLARDAGRALDARVLRERQRRQVGRRAPGEARDDRVRLRPPAPAEVEGRALRAEDGRDPVEEAHERPVGGAVLLRLGLQLLRDLLLELEDLRARRQRVEEVLRAERVLHARLQLPRGERLRHVVVRERLEALEEVLLVGARRDEDDLGARGRRGGLHAATHLVAREVRHFHVEQDHVRGPLRDLLERFVAGERGLEIATELVRDVRGDLGLIGIVVDEEQKRSL